MIDNNVFFSFCLVLRLLSWFHFLHRTPAVACFTFHWPSRNRPIYNNNNNSNVKTTKQVFHRSQILHQLRISVPILHHRIPCPVCYNTIRNYPFAGKRRIDASAQIRDRRQRRTRRRHRSWSDLSNSDAAPFTNSEVSSKRSSEVRTRRTKSSKCRRRRTESCRFRSISVLCRRTFVFGNSFRRSNRFWPKRSVLRPEVLREIRVQTNERVQVKN